MSSRWQDVWIRSKAFEANPVAGKEKFFLTAAFMYPNAPAHIGHARVYMIADIIARFMRMLRYNVLYPMGFHYTGTPILAMAESIAKNDESFIKELMELYNLTTDDVRSLADPLQLARYFHIRSKKAMIKLGLSIDWRREFTTVDPEFKAFIRWQFEKLREKGFIERGSHPVGWCPNHQMPVGMHDTKDDVEPEIDEVTVIYFISDSNGDLLLPVATLRPETVLGVTNLWVNPNSKYCICELVENEKRSKVLLSCDAAYKLSFQFKLDIISEVEGKELVGSYAINPLTGDKVEILEAEFVDPKFGTGLVMSVPAHAPYDYIALLEYAKNVGSSKFRVIPLIRVPNYSEIPARDVIEKLGIESQKDIELLDRATREVYLIEFNSGVMRGDLQELLTQEIIPNARKFIELEVNNSPVPKARESIKKFLMENGYASTIYEIMNRPVYCRCGSEIVVKLLENQWFINYGDLEWKKLAHQALSLMKLVPEESRRQFEATINWLQRKACARSRGLGTELPWEKGWIIESLSDSTIYMAFYTVIHKLREYSIAPEKLVREFWDYILLGEGDVNELSSKLGIPIHQLIDLRDEFKYWYPLDMRLSGKDLIPNHLTFFIFNHVAIFPKELWPKSIVTNGWVLREGEKMSKSKRNVLTLEDAIRRYSPDGVRASLALAAEVEQDLDFRESHAYSVIEHLRSIESLILKSYNWIRKSNTSIADRWLLSKLQRYISSVKEDLINVRIRSASIKVLYLMYQDLIDYLTMTNNMPSEIVKEYIDAWIKMMSPIIPHLAEELWHRMGNKTLLVSEEWPAYSEKMIDNEAELAIEFIKMLIDDVREVMKLVKGCKEVVLYVSSKDEYKDLVNIINQVNKGVALNEIIRQYVSSMRSKDVGEGIRRIKRLYELATSLRPDIRELILASGGIDELRVVGELSNYIKSMLSINNITIYYCRDPNAPNLGGKKEVALPFKPGIYVIT